MKKRLFVVLILTFLALWVFWPKNETVKNQQSPNILTHEDNLPDTLKVPLSKSQVQNQQSKNSFEHSGTEAISDQTTFSYLQLYRDFRRLEICPLNKKNIWAGISARSVKQQQLKSFEDFGTQNNHPVSATHLNHYETFLNRCIQLTEKYKDIDMTQLLVNAPTITDKEKQLQALRRLIQPWDNAWQHLLNASKGIISPEAVAIKKQLDTLEAGWREQYRNPELVYTETERNMHFETVKALKAQLDQLTGENPQVKEQAWQDVQKLTAQIKAYMRLQDPDLFFEASALLNDDRNFRFLNASIHGNNFKSENLEKLNIPYKKVAEEVNQLTGPISRLNFLGIAPYANLLYLCTLGHDCAPNSIIMDYYCSKAEYPTACEKDLAAFFTDDYLSPNQLQDVINLLEQLGIIYAP